jgi:histone H3/H4
MVTKEAAEELSKSLEKIAFEIAKIAVLCADDEARLKVTDEDVRSALREYFER